MIRLPLRFRAIGDSYLFVNDAGVSFRGDRTFLDRMATSKWTSEDDAFLLQEGHAASDDGDLRYLAHLQGLARRIAAPKPLQYLILVPTLRCNLDCSYCQVSRVPVQQPGFDWTEETLAAVLRLIDELSGPQVKIEFQGGEPLLRPDLLRRVIEHTKRRLPEASFVICTNLSRLDGEALDLIARPDVFVSTSLDGPVAVHERNRTRVEPETRRFELNMAQLVDEFGPNKVSALPTVDIANPPDMDGLIDAYIKYGLTSIYLRPVNYQGFARKRHAYVRNDEESWHGYYAAFVRRLIARNWVDRAHVIEEFYFKLCLRRIFQPGHDDHVDLRNPNLLGTDYLVIDHDGALYPTDEARMVTRSGVMDLRIGDVQSGIDHDTLATLNRFSSNNFDADCVHCAYQPYCGRDVVDDIARHGRIDLQRRFTAFCQRHLAIFDLAFELIHSQDPQVHYSLRRWLDMPGDGPLPVAELHD